MSPGDGLALVASPIHMMLPSRQYVEDGSDMDEGRFGIVNAHLAQRFIAATEADLRTAAAHYLYRKRR